MSCFLNGRRKRSTQYSKRFPHLRVIVKCFRRHESPHLWRRPHPLVFPCTYVRCELMYIYMYLYVFVWPPELYPNSNKNIASEHHRGKRKVYLSACASVCILHTSSLALTMPEIVERVPCEWACPTVHVSMYASQFVLVLLFVLVLFFSRSLLAWFTFLEQQKHRTTTATKTHTQNRHGEAKTDVKSVLCSNVRTCVSLSNKSANMWFCAFLVLAKSKKEKSNQVFSGVIWFLWTKKIIS